MGRARGKKGDRGTGDPASGRGAWAPELEDLQRRGGMSPDWHQAVHGRGRGVELRLESFPHVNTQTLRDLYTAPWMRYRTRQLLLGYSRGVSLQGDRVIEALFENEWMRMHLWADRYEGATGERSILQDIKREDIFPLWQNSFVRSLEDPERSEHYVPSSSLFCPYFFNDILSDKKLLSRLLEEWDLWGEVDPEGFAEFIQDEGPRSLDHMSTVMGRDFYSERVFDRIAKALAGDWDGPGPESFARACRGDDVLASDNPAEIYRGMFASFRTHLRDREENTVSDMDQIYGDALRGLLVLRYLTGSKHPVWDEWKEHLQGEGVQAGLVHQEIEAKLKGISSEQGRRFAAGEISAEEVLRELFG